MSKFKVINNNLFNVGIRFENEANREILIRGNSFVNMNEDDILYTDTASKLFSEGILFVEDQELNSKMGYGEKNPNSISDEDILKTLSLSVTKMKDAFLNIDAQHAKEKIIALAKSSDLAPSKLKALEELFGIEVLEDLGKDVV